MTKWTYKAERLSDGTVAAWVVLNPEQDIDPAKYALHHFVKHSPTGFEMGYGGSGPADLAYSILVHWFLSYKFSLEEAQEEAWAQHQAFKWAFVAKEREHLSIPDDVIGNWWIQKETGEAHARLAGGVAQAN